jgi:cytochrome d ubiquinol oxidase subunit I
MLRGRRDRYHRLGLLLPLTVAALATPLQILVGDVAARGVFENEPAKFAAIEALARTETHVPEILGGAYVDGQVRYGVGIPWGASVLSGFRPSTRIRGLDAVPAEFRPADRLVTTVHLAFDVMVGVGFALLALSAWFAWCWWRRRDLPSSPWFLRCTAVSGVLAVVALEAGWVVTEVGRQPWTVVGYLLTRDAVNKTGNIWLFFGATVALYAVVGAATVYVLRLLRGRWGDADQAAGGEGDVPYGPSRAREGAGRGPA